MGKQALPNDVKMIKEKKVRARKNRLRNFPVRVEIIAKGFARVKAKSASAASSRVNAVMHKEFEKFNFNVLEIDARADERF